MNFQEAKKIPIVDYLSGEGFQPAYTRSVNVWYLSPIHTEQTPSFKVDISKNVWYDYGIGTGGGIYLLVQLLKHAATPSEVLKELNAAKIASPSSFSFDTPVSSGNDELSFSVHPLHTRILLDYITHIRGISKDVAQNECSEIKWYEREKRYFGIAFNNDSGGYEVRGAVGNYKRCIGQKSVTHIKQGGDACLVFEGFMDYLSYLCYKECGSHADEPLKGYDFLILNSTSMARNAIGALGSYSNVYLLLDNDESGRRATEIIQSGVGTCTDLSYKLAPFNDFNEWYVMECTKG